jgi:hypothetical protein
LEILAVNIDQIATLSDHQCERLLQEVFEKLLEDGVELPVDDEESARELLAAFVSQHSDPVHSDDVLRPAVGLDVYVRDVLALLAEDCETGAVVREALDDLPEETQMFAEPITAAIVLGVLVAFLQTKINFKISRRNGKTDFEFSLAKKASSDRLVGKVVDAVRNVTVR